MNKLTRKQKLNIIRIIAANLISQSSDALFDNIDITEDDRHDLIKGLQNKGINMTKNNEPDYFESNEQIVRYVQKYY